MTNWENPSQQPQQAQQYQSSMGQQIPPPPPQAPESQPFMPYPSPIGQPPYQPPTTNPSTPYQPPISQQLPPYQSATEQRPLRKKYTPDQIFRYFHPFPNRGPKIRELQEKRTRLRQQIGALIFADAIIFIVWLIGSTKQGIAFGLLGFACIVGIAVYIYRLVKNTLRPLNEELNQELAADAREKAHTEAIQPPGELQYDEWISAIANEIYEKAPTSLRLHEHPDHQTWKKELNSGFQIEEPEKFGASLYLEGRSDEKNEEPSQLVRRTSESSTRLRHYSAYVFTALFIAEDYIAIYTNTVNLRDSTRDREEFEYCYHQHLSHMLLDVDTISPDFNVQLQEQIELTESNLSLTFDSGRTIRRNISTLRIGNQSISGIANIHEKLTRALIDHKRSMPRVMADSAE